ncbi:MAG: hypothetical protein WC470_01635 [Candidatus Paceibacterota bacterium]
MSSLEIDTQNPGGVIEDVTGGTEEESESDETQKEIAMTVGEITQCLMDDCLTVDSYTLDMATAIYNIPFFTLVAYKKKLMEFEEEE